MKRIYTVEAYNFYNVKFIFETYWKGLKRIPSKHVRIDIREIYFNFLKE